MRKLTFDDLRIDDDEKHLDKQAGPPPEPPEPPLHAQVDTYLPRPDLGPNMSTYIPAGHPLPQ